MTPSSLLPAPSSQCYLVTGAAGFIAARVCEMLLAEGHTVVGVDNLNDYYDVRLKDYRLSRLLSAEGEGQSGKSFKPGADAKRSVYLAKGEGQGAKSGLPLPLTAGRFAFYPLDIENLPALEALFAAHQFTAVFNLAARAGVRYSIENPHVYLSTNTLGTLNILECMRKHGVKKHVLASTSSLYAGCPMPFTEDQPVNTPLSPYAATKKAAEMLSWTWHKIHGIDTTVVRYFTVYGPAGRPDMAPFRFVHWVATGQPIKLFGDGTATRDFTYVDDIARGTILAGRFFGGKLPAAEADLSAPSSELPAPGYEVINLGGGNRPIAINAMIALIEKELNEQSAVREVTSAKDQVTGGGISNAKASNTEEGREIGAEISNDRNSDLRRSSPFKAKIDYLPVNPVDMTDTQADITKAGRLLGWKPEVSPEDGFRKTVAWYLENCEWLKDVSV